MRAVLNSYVFLMVAVGVCDAQTQSEEDIERNLYRHVFVKQGEHASELKTGNYVVAAMALTEADAQSTLKEFLKLKYPEPICGYASLKSIWYICYGPFSDIEDAKQKKDEYRKQQLSKNAYLLTVHE